MSKGKLAFMIFCAAFAANALGFFAFKKIQVVEDVKTIWLFEMPRTPGPWDSYSSQILGPSQGVIGTLIASGTKKLYLAEKWNWNEKRNLLEVTLRQGLTYSNGDKIEAKDFVETHDYIVSELAKLSYIGDAIPQPLRSWFEAKLSADGLKLVIKFPGKMADPVDLLANLWTGVIHPKNRSPGFDVKEPKKWISSGNYKIWKWKPREIILASRDNFVVGYSKDYFRNLKYQNSPVRNPAADILSSAETDGSLGSSYERREGDFGIIHALIFCRSWAQVGRICADASSRNAFLAKLNNTQTTDSVNVKTAALNIPYGEGVFRDQAKQKVLNALNSLGVNATELSPLFGKSSDADFELIFVNNNGNDANETRFMASFSSRLRDAQGNLPTREAAQTLFWESTQFKQVFYTKDFKGNLFLKLFVDPHQDD